MTETAQLTELITVRDFLRFAVTRFGEAGLSYGHGTATALDDAAFLILETLHLPVDSLEPWLDARLTRPERATLAALIERRVVTRMPAAYLTKSAYIGPHRFYVDERVIVPRSFIGELLQDELASLLDLDPVPLRILDLCTGSGCLAILAAHTFPGAIVTGGDLSRDALAVAAENVKRHRLDGRVSLVETDLFGRLDGEAYDLILCNPPYVTAAAVATFPPEYKAEPVLAHLGGTDGMELVRRVLAAAADHLTPHGTLVMEVGQGRATLERGYPGLPFLWLDSEGSTGEVFALSAEALQDGLKPKPKPVKKRATEPKPRRR